MEINEFVWGDAHGPISVTFSRLLDAIMLTAAPLIDLRDNSRPRPAPTTAPAPSSDRLLSLDAARVIATLGVVWFHSIECDAFHASGVVGRFSVAFYTMAAMVFLVQSSNRRQRPYLSYITNRLRRLYLPFLGWSAITVLVLYLVTGPDKAADLPKFSWDMLVDGGTLHLWYVPFLLVASLLVYPLTSWMRGNSARKWILAGGCLAIAIALDLGLFAWLPVVRGPVVGRFQEMTAERWSAVYWGVAIAIGWSSGLVRARWRVPLGVLGGIALIGTTAWQWKFGVGSALKVYGGMGLLLMALAPWKNAVIGFLGKYGRMSSGVYFAHMAAIYIIRALIAADGAANVGRARDVVVFIGATILAFGTISAMAIIPGLQWLAGYDEASKSRTVTALRPVVAEDPG